MDRRVVRNVPNMRMLRKLSAKQRKEYINHCPSDFINCLCECSKNLIKGNVPLSTSQLKSLRRHKKVLRKLSTKNASDKTRRKLLQTGGFLPLLVAPLLGLASSLIGGAINRAADRKK